jgi:hypothetical protein
MSNQTNLSHPATPATDSVGGAGQAPLPESTPQLIKGFDFNLIRKYPRSNRKVGLAIAPYSILSSEGNSDSTQSIHISPHGMEFQAQKDYPEGTLLKIQVALPDYWTRKQRFVDYQRIDTPGDFKVLAKVVKTEDLGKRGKKKLVTVQMVNMDEVDEQVLKSFLQDG